MTTRLSLVTPDDPDDTFGPVRLIPSSRVMLTPPPHTLFVDNVFLGDPNLDILAGNIIGDHSLPASLFRIAYAWKRTGGKCLGKCIKVNPAVSFLTGHDFFIWLAADHCRDRHYPPQRIEALLFHELRHIDADKHGKPILVDHDFVGFRDELDLYGCWEDDLAAAQIHFAQATIWQDEK